MNLFRRRRVRLGIGAIMRNEGRYVLEWIAHHRRQGIEQFFIADNNSDDGTELLLQALDDAGVITRLPFPGAPDRPAQMWAYQVLLNRFGPKLDWMAFVDADELLTAAPGTTLARFLSRLPPRVGAVAVNWRVYGSSRRGPAGTGLVSERFTWRARDDRPVNSYFKSIVRPHAVERPRNPHKFTLKPDYQVVGADGAPIDFAESGRTDRISFEAAHIRHYVIKSRAEFLHVKRPRGRAGKAASMRDEAFFDQMDINDVEDVPSATEISRLERDVAGLKTLLKGLPAEVRDMDLSLPQEV